MAKKDKKKSKKKDQSGADPVGAVRTAVEKTFHATADGAQSTRTRAQELVDELAGASKRVREMIEQVGVLEDLKRQVESLASRVAQLERSDGGSSTASRPAAKKKPAARKPAARKTAARRTAARKTAARKTAAKKPAASSSRSTTAKSPARKRAPAKKSS